ncbi:MAG: hypothetical protein M1839_002569 [Geoglossum umbratile]|nr:MAG: hypothetical protein M1839_002569 [Geoglossum umbratile]
MSVVPATIPEDQPEDRAIISNVSLLSTHIEQHVENCYDRTLSAAIRRQIAQAIIQRVILGRMSYLDVSREISSSLQSRVSGAENQMNDLCKLGTQIREYIDSHAADWRWGTFDSGVVFPSLFRGEQVVRPQEVVGAGA